MWAGLVRGHVLKLLFGLEHHVRGMLLWWLSRG